MIANHPVLTKTKEPAPAEEKWQPLTKEENSRVVSTVVLAQVLLALFIYVVFF